MTDKSPMEYQDVLHVSPTLGPSSWVVFRFRFRGASKSAKPICESGVSEVKRESRRMVGKNKS
jgi:hypothetical protein